MREWLEGIKQTRIAPYIALLVVAGVALALIGGWTERNAAEASLVPALALPAPDDLEARLGSVLSSIEGAGDVAVLITRDEANDAQGVIVVADGAVSYEVRLTLLDAVKAALGLPASRIEILPRAQTTPIPTIGRNE